MKSFTFLTTAFVLLAIGGCDTPQKPQDIGIESARPSQALTEAEKNVFVRSLVQELRQRFGSNAILSIRSVSPREINLDEKVKIFGSRAAIPYRENRGFFEIRFELNETQAPGAYVGETIYEMSASLFRVNSANEGDELVAISRQRYRCKLSSNKPQGCETTLQAMADDCLYSLRFIGGR